MNQLVHFARGFAIGAHGDQKYGSGAPYYVHLDAVSDVLLDFKIDSIYLHKAAYLHDVLEDTQTTPETIQNLFGADVLALVQAVTNEPGANRKERHLKTYPKIRKAGEWAMMLKLADRIANVSASLADTAGGKIGMYRKEHASFKEALFTPSNPTIQAMWTHLDNLMGTKTDKLKVYVVISGSNILGVYRKPKDAEAAQGGWPNVSIQPVEVE
jgi:(p)ppGpp synthase/HD superfamily hydrolase